MIQPQRHREPTSDHQRAVQVLGSLATSLSEGFPWLPPGYLSRFHVPESAAGGYLSAALFDGRQRIHLMHRVIGSLPNDQRARHSMQALDVIGGVLQDPSAEVVHSSTLAQDGNLASGVGIGIKSARSDVLALAIAFSGLDGFPEDAVLTLLVAMALSHDHTPYHAHLGEGAAIEFWKNHFDHLRVPD